MKHSNPTLLCVSQAAQGAVRLEGDVITANGSILSCQIGNHGNAMSLDDETSVCSCRCSDFQRKRRRPRFTVRRSPGMISHLLPMQHLSTQNVHGDGKGKLRSTAVTPLLQMPSLHQHRASI
jgi:potassium channel subfamily K protein